MATLWKSTASAKQTRHQDLCLRADHAEQLIHKGKLSLPAQEQVDIMPAEVDKGSF